MKHMNIVISAIVIAAVLVAAYAVGLLVRHVRTQNDQSGLLAASVAEDAAARQAGAEQQAPGVKRARRAEGPTPEQVRQQREQLLEKMKTMTEEEKRKYMEEEVRKRFGTNRGKGQSRALSPQDQERTLQKRRQIHLGEQKSQVGGTQPPASGSDPNATPQTPAQTSDVNQAGEG
ncbi:MAG: hypothetical protein JW955_07835 [Sedimentisphaerales bacterium]|nr:hypothetical protein [Sedimentisphaerales bacterium]